MRARRVSRYPEEVQAGSERLSLGYLEWDKNNLEQMTCESCFAFGTSAHEQVMVAWCYECVARGCERYGMYVGWMCGIVVCGVRWVMT